MEMSIFMDKSIVPATEELKEALGKSYFLWEEIRDYVFELYPSAKEEWNYPGKKYGWSFRIKDKKRAIIYFLPRENNFKVAFVFGQKATDQIMQGKIDDEIKEELQNARVYAEGRGIRIDVIDQTILDDIKKLIQIKIAN